jgi:hypothetical protein
LVFFTVIGFSDLVGTECLRQLKRVRQRSNSIGVGLLHLVDESKD